MIMENAKEGPLHLFIYGCSILMRLGIENDFPVSPLINLEDAGANHFLLLFINFHHYVLAACLLG